MRNRGRRCKRKRWERERDLLCVSLSRRETLLVWTRVVVVKMDLKNIQEVDFDFEKSRKGGRSQGSLVGFRLEELDGWR